MQSQPWLLRVELWVLQETSLNTVRPRGLNSPLNINSTVLFNAAATLGSVDFTIAGRYQQQGKPDQNRGIEWWLLRRVFGRLTASKL